MLDNSNSLLRSSDGRRQRASRTRHAFVQTYLDLLKLQISPPTANDVARGANRSPRSLFTHFKTLGDLAVASGEYCLKAQKSWPTRMPGNREHRIEEFVKYAIRVRDQWTPLWRISLATRSPDQRLLSLLEESRRALVDTCQLVFAGELAHLPPDKCRRAAIAVEFVIAFENWERMHSHYGYSPREIRDVWCEFVNVILPGGNLHPDRSLLGTAVAGRDTVAANAQ